MRGERGSCARPSGLVGQSMRPTRGPRRLASARPVDPSFCRLRSARLLRRAAREMRVFSGDEPEKVNMSGQVAQERSA